MASGTPRKITLDGTSFNWSADADITQEPATTTEGIATSGNTMPKIIKKVPMHEGEIIAADGDWQTLLELTTRIDAFPISWENVNGSIYRCTGWINIENKTSSENRATAKMIPETDWAYFG